MTSAPVPFRNATEMWSARIAAQPDKTAYRYRTTDGWADVTWRQANEKAREIAAGLASLGIKPGQRVCILAQTRLEWMLSDVGILMAGAVTVPIYPQSTAEQCAFMIKDSGARAIICEDAAQVEKLLPLLTYGDLRVIHMDGDATLEKPDARGRAAIKLAEVMSGAPAGTSSAVFSMEAIYKAGRTWLTAGNNAADLDRRAKDLGPQDPFTIIYTSGTTGTPKGVVLSHENLVAACASAVRALTLHDTDVQFLWLTLAHVLGREIAWAPILVGFPVVFAQGLPKLKDNLLEVRPTFMAGVPRIYEKFYAAVQAGMQQGSGVKRALVSWAFGVGKKHSAAVRSGKKPGPILSLQHGWAEKLVLTKLRAKLGLDNCRFLISGGAPLAAEIAEFFHAAGLLILEGYGLTETTAAAFLNTPGLFSFGTVGPPLDAVEVKIADDGEILMRGPTIFKRYHNNPEATAEAIDTDGWFHSGDIGQLESNRCLRITDRKKDLIVTAAGKKVAPQMVENALKARSSVISQAMFYGDNRPYCIALITLTEEAVKKYGDGDSAKAAASPEVKSIVEKDVAAVNATLASHESIKKFSILPTDFTEAAGDLTPSLKVKRKVVIERQRALIDSLYAK